MAERDSSVRRVLVVDDEPSIADTLAAIVRTQGYDAAIAYSGEAAIEVARTFRPDFLLSDIRMPGISGIDAAIEMLKFLPEMSVLFISGHAVTDDVLAGSKARGFTFEVCSKPIAPVALLQKIGQMCPRTGPDAPTILNVDDNAINRYAVTRMLKQSGFDVVEAATGEEALRLARTAAPSLILLDINLPDKNGFEVLVELRNSPETADIPVVHLTASYFDEESRETALRLGAQDYFTHPVEAEPLLQALHKLAEKTKR